MWFPCLTTPLGDRGSSMQWKSLLCKFSGRGSFLGGKRLQMGEIFRKVGFRRMSKKWNSGSLLDNLPLPKSPPSSSPEGATPSCILAEKQTKKPFSRVFFNFFVPSLTTARLLIGEWPFTMSGGLEYFFWKSEIFVGPPQILYYSPWHFFDKIFCWPLSPNTPWPFP